MISHWINNKYALAIKHHYTTPLEIVFKQFRLGGAIFLLGFVLIYTSKQMPESTIQELMLLVGLGAVIIGFIIAIMAHIRMTIIRLVNVFNPINKNSSDVNSDK